MPQRIFDFKIGATFLVSNFSHLNMVDQTQTAKSRTFFTENCQITLSSPVFYFSANRELFCFLQLPVCSSILPGNRCEPDPTEQPKWMPASSKRLLCSSGLACAADQNYDGLRYAATGVPGWPSSPLGSSFLDVPGHRNHRQDTCCRHKASYSYHCNGKCHRHFSIRNGYHSKGTGVLSFELVSFS